MSFNKDGPYEDQQKIRECESLMHLLNVGDVYNSIENEIFDAEVVALQIAFFFFFLPADSMMLCY